MGNIQVKMNRWTATVIAVAACFVCAASAQAVMIHYNNFDEGAGSDEYAQVGTNPQNGTFGEGKDPNSDWITSPLVGGGTALQFFGVRGDGIEDDPRVHPERKDRVPHGPKNDVVRFGDDASFALTEAGTIMFWMRQDPGPDGDGSGYGADGAVSNPDNSNWIIVRGTDPFSYLIHNEPSQGMPGRLQLDGGPDSTTPTPLPVGDWVHLAYGWDASVNSTRLWVDGELVGNNANAWNGLNDHGGPFVLGGHDVHTGTGRGFLGASDELKVFDELLDNDAVQNAMFPVVVADVPIVFPGAGKFTAIDATRDVHLTLTGDPGVAYDLETTTGLPADAWTYSGLSVTGAAGAVQISDPSGSDSNKSYRLAARQATAVPGAQNHDFETSTLEDWLVTGEAFIATQNHRGLRPWKGDYHLWDHEHYATSDLGTATGTMKSAVFTIPTADQMTFYISGFDGPDPNPAGQSLVRLVRASDLAVLFQEFCPQSTRWERVAWDVFPHAGTDVFIDVVDGNPSATEGWIAVDDFELGTDEVLSPWPSVTTTGDTVHVWGRDYDWGVLPLPEQVTSGGTDLLAGPMRLDAAVSGQPVSWTPAGGQAADAALTTPSGAAATIQRSATGRGVRVDGFAVTEFDGMIRVDLTFSPVSGPVTLNHLYVEIPLDPQVADLMYLYYVPFYGQRTAGAAASFTGPFQSIAWLGDEERGLTWFAESDKGWLPSGNTGAVRVIPGAQETVLQLRIWNQSHTLSSAETFTMGLQATPVKPLPIDWHQRSIAGNVDWYGNEGYGSLRLQDLVNQDVKVISSGENWAAIQNYPEAWCCRQELLSAKKLQSSGTIPAGVWKHVAASWDADTRQAVLYIDGVAADQINDFVGLVSQPDRPFVIGGDMNVNQSRQFDGIMDEVRIYDRFLSAPEVMQAMSAAIPAGPGGLVHGYAFEESGTTVLDSVGSENGAFGTAKTTGDWTTGRYGGGLHFRATSPAGGDFVDFGTASSFDLIEEGTVMAWIYEMTQDSESFFMQKGREVNFPYMLTSSTYWNSMTLELSTGSFYCPCEDPADDSYGELVDQIHAFGLKTIPYFGFLYADIAPEYDLYSAECFRTPQSIPGYKREASGGTPPQESFDVCNRSRYTDLLLDGVELVRDMYGVDGVYLDATTLASICKNRLHGCGYVAGSLRGTYPIFPTRTLMKRLSALFPEDQGGIIEAHLQMGVFPPAMSFATSLLDGEWFYLLGNSGQHILNYATLESHRAHFGNHWGVRTRLLDSTPNPWTDEELMSMTMLQDTFIRPSRALPTQMQHIMTLKGVYSAFGADDAEWHGYWDNQAVVTPSHPANIKASVFARQDNNTALLVVSNLGNGTIGNAGVTLNLGALGLGALSSGTMHSFDGTTRAVAVSGGTVTIGSLPKWTPRVVVLR